MACGIFTLTKNSYIHVLKSTSGSIKVLITNKKITPYNLYDDTMEFKIAITRNNRQMYAANVSGEVFGNFWTTSEDFQSLGSFITNQYGIAKFHFPTDSIPRKDINAATFYAKLSAGGSEYVSHKCEANYLTYIPADFSFIIDAGSYTETGPWDRSDYNIYTAVDNTDRSNYTIIDRTAWS